MTEKEAREIVSRVDDNEETVGRFNNLSDLGSRYWIAKGFLGGLASRDSKLQHMQKIQDAAFEDLDIYRAKLINRDALIKDLVEALGKINRIGLPTNMSEKEINKWFENVSFNALAKARSILGESK